MTRVPKRLIKAREIIAMAERRIAAQRERVQRWQGDGDRPAAVRSLALVKLMEQTAKQMRNARTIRESNKLVGKRASTTSLSGPQPPATSRSCSRCGLPTRLVDLGDGSFTLQYEHCEWARRCEYRVLGSAALCRLEASDLADKIV
jgi:hypothetical protein